MPVFEGSRYVGVGYTAITGTDLLTRKYLHPRTPLTDKDVDPEWIIHTVVEGDDLDLLAYLYANKDANKSQFWWLIADVNNILWPLDLPIGTDLVIPLRELALRGLR